MEDIFKDYTEVIKQSLESVLKDYKVGKDDGPVIMYGRTPAAFAKFKERVKNGKNVGPLISYTLSNITIDHNQQMLGYGSLRVENGGYVIQRAPLIASLDYKITINCLSEEEGNILGLELLMAAPFARPFATMKNGQWITFTIEEMSDNSNSETDEIYFKKELKLTIQRVYLDYPLKEIKDNIIGDIKITVKSLEGKK